MVETITSPVASKASVHVRTWSGSRTARITDMTNAGKRGKTCRILRVMGMGCDYWIGNGNPVVQAAIRCTQDLMHFLSKAESDVPVEVTFDDVREFVLLTISTYRAMGVTEGQVSAHDEEIKGIDAPREPLTAGVDGKWSASANESGITIHDLNDVNEWTEITHGQTGARAYEIARKVWGQVELAQTRYEAMTILRNAGAKLHGYCGMD